MRIGKDDKIAALIVLICAVVFTIVGMGSAKAQTVTPYVELGAYHMTRGSQLLTEQPWYGTDTPGKIDVGLNFKNCKYLLLADSCDLVYHHQSFVDRGFPFNNKPETFVEMLGIQVRWNLGKINF